MGTSSCGLTPQIQRILALSFLQSLCKSGAVGAQVSLPCNRAERMQALTLFHELMVTHAWKSVLEVAVEHLVAIARAHPPPALNMSSR